jgi:type IV pilus assembly protein PilV
MKMNPKSRRLNFRSLRFERGRGFTLVEMLVALVVLSVGMLGVAGLFVVSLRSGSSAILRMQAVNLASDMADRIRANRRAKVAYMGAAADDNCVGAGALVCTPEQLAATDLFLWQAAIKATFPGNSGQGSVTYVDPVIASDPASYTIKVWWKEQAQTLTEPTSDQSYSIDILVPTT